MASEMFRVVEMYEKEMTTGNKEDKSLAKTWIDLRRFLTRMDLNSLLVRRFLRWHSLSE